MRHLMGLVLAGGILLGTAGESDAQFAISIGNPYTGQGFSVGNPGYGYNSGYSNFSGIGPTGYYNGYNNYSNSAYLAGPGTLSYSSGYQGYAPPVAGYGYGVPVNPYRYVAPVNPYGYINRPYYGAYGYGGYGYGSRDGFRPFRGMGGLFR